VSGKRSRDKGARRERQVVKLFRDLGLPAERVPLSGASGGEFKGDVLFGWPGEKAPHRRVEVKGRARAAGWKTVKQWLDDNEALLLIEDGREPLVVLPWSVFGDIVYNRMVQCDSTTGPRSRSAGTAGPSR
jgi:hypothetical protein